MSSKRGWTLTRRSPALTLALAGVLSSCASLPQNELSNSDRVLVIAHRGASGYRPEHTRAAYELAAEMGADFIEPDLVITQDGVLIVRHENEISETTDVAQKFPERQKTKTINGREIRGWFSEDFTLSEIKTLRAVERTQTRDQSFNGKYEVLTFQEVLALAKELSQKHKRTIGVYPETKYPSYFKSLGFKIEDALLNDLGKLGFDHADSPVFIQSFELTILKNLKKRTQLPLIFLIGAPGEQPGDHHHSGNQGTYRDYLSFWGFLKLRQTVYGIGPHKSMILRENKDKNALEPTALMKLANYTGLKVHAYTFRSDKDQLHSFYQGQPEREYLEFCKLGVDGVFTDFPDHAVQAIKNCAR